MDVWRRPHCQKHVGASRLFDFQSSGAQMARNFNPADNLPPPKPKSPPGATKSTRNAGKPWSREDVRMLKALAKENTPTRVIGLKLGRTETSVRGKVRSEGISLKPTNRSPYGRA
jgi:hypothetical protein